MMAWWFNIDLGESVVTLCLTLSLSGVRRFFVDVYYVPDNAWFALCKAAPDVRFTVIHCADFMPFRTRCTIGSTYRYVLPRLWRLTRMGCYRTEPHNV